MMEGKTATKRICKSSSSGKQQHLTLSQRLMRLQQWLQPSAAAAGVPVVTEESQRHHHQCEDKEGTHLEQQ